MTLHEEVLAPSQKRALRALGPLMTVEDFYLAGGTAVAIHLGHRRSIDMDWFTGRAMGDALALAARVQEGAAPLSVDQVAPGTLYGRVLGVRVTFLEYHYPLLAETVTWADYSSPLASLDDLACMKLSAITQRGARKDFIDLYALVTRHRPLPELLAAYQQKYNIEDIAHVLYGLTYFDDADRERSPTVLWNLDWRTIKKAMRSWVKEVAA